MPPVLTKKMMGLPRWAWLAILAGGLTVGLILRSRNQGNADNADPNAADADSTDPEVDPTAADQFGYLPDPAAYDSGLTLSPAAEGGYYQQPSEPNTVQPGVAPTDDGGGVATAPKPKRGKRGPRGKKGERGPRGKKGGPHGRGKSHKHHQKKAHANAAMTGGGPPNRRAVHAGPRHRRRHR